MPKYQHAESLYGKLRSEVVVGAGTLLPLAMRQVEDIPKNALGGSTW
jgi:hypothetical protein